MDRTILEQTVLRTNILFDLYQKGKLGSVTNIVERGSTDSLVLTGTPTTPTPDLDSNNLQIANTAYINLLLQSIDAEDIIQSDAYNFVTDEQISFWNNQQPLLVSGVNIKTINNQSLLGSGNINIIGGEGGSVTVDTDLDDGSLNPIANNAVYDAFALRPAAVDGIYPESALPAVIFSPDDFAGEGTEEDPLTIIGLTPPTLQTVTDTGSSTTNSITASSFVKSGGTSGQFLKANGSVDSSTYLTANQNITLTGDVTGSGNGSFAATLATVNSNVGTFNNVTVNAKGLVTAASNVSYLTALSDTLQTVSSRGATTSTSLTAASFIKSGGTSAQFLKADGSVDSSTYLTTAPTLQSVTDEGNTSTNDIFLQNERSIQFGADDVPQLGLRGVTGNIVFDDLITPSQTIVLDTTPLTLSRTYNLPDASGTLLLSVNGESADDNGNVDVTSSQWKNVTGGINYAGGFDVGYFVGINNPAPEAYLEIYGQNINNYVKLLGADSSTYYNSISFRTEDNSVDDFGNVSFFLNPEEGISLNARSSDNLTSCVIGMNKTELSILSNDDIKIIIKDGNIGIKNDEPDYDLDIIGDVNFTGDLYNNGSLYAGQSSITTVGYITSGTWAGNPIADAQISSATDWNNKLTNNSTTLSSLSIGNSSGSGAVPAQVVYLGEEAGASSGTSTASVFIGKRAGYFASDAAYSVQIGGYAGYSATSTDNTVFIGNSAGSNATSSNSSTFIGTNAGINAASCVSSTYIGVLAGSYLTNSDYAVCIGSSTGSYASNCDSSIFIGNNTGADCVDAIRSICIGYSTGSSFPFAVKTNFIGADNIIIGTNISLPNASAASLNIGGALFGTGLNSTIGTDPIITPISGSKIGIGVVTPHASSKLEIVSTSTGVLLPRMTKTQRDAISSPAQGLVVYVTDNGGYLSWYEGGWQKVSSVAD